MRARPLGAFLSSPSRKSHTLVIDFPLVMKNVIVLKQVDKISGVYQEFRFKPFEDLDDKAKTFKSILGFLDKALNSECILQIENFKEHNIEELNIF